LDMFDHWVLPIMLKLHLVIVASIYSMSIVVFFNLSLH